jgi:hypothetical protein
VGTQRLTCGTVPTNQAFAQLRLKREDLSSRVKEVFERIEHLRGHPGPLPARPRVTVLGLLIEPRSPDGGRPPLSSGQSLRPRWNIPPARGDLHEASSGVNSPASPDGRGRSGPDAWRDEALSFAGERKFRHNGGRQCVSHRDHRQPGRPRRRSSRHRLDRSNVRSHIRDSDPGVVGRQRRPQGRLIRGEDP